MSRWFLVFTLILTLAAVAYTPDYRTLVSSTLDEPHCLSGPGHLASRLPNRVDESWDVQHVDLLVQPFFGTETLEGRVTLDAESLVEDLSEIHLDFNDPMTVLSVTVNGVAAAWTHGSDRISVTLSPPISQGVVFEISVDFEGQPVPVGFGSFAWDEVMGHPIVCTLSEPEGARSWWPCKDVPNDKFTADVRYRVPNGISAPGPGLLQSVNDHGDGTETWHWQENWPINTYLIAMTASEYTHYTDWYDDGEGNLLPIENYIYIDTWDNAVEDLSITPEALGLYEDLYGEYPFKDEKYGHALFTWAGAMEHQTCTSYGWWLLFGDHRYDRIVAHELAHQWWGDMVTLEDWENVWLNEGFATYSEALWFEHRDGQSGLSWYMNEIIRDFDGPVYNNPNLFGQEVYKKGAWVLHMTRWLINDDEAFYGALDYYKNLHAYGNAHTTDLQSDLENYLGLDLEQWFSQWIYGIERPIYEWAWQKTGSPGAWELEIRVDQVQTLTGLFEMPIPFRLETDSGFMDLRLDNDQWSTLYTIPMGYTEPVDLLFDPDSWILKDETEVPFDPTGAGEAPQFRTEILGNYPNPFNPATHVSFVLAEQGPVSLKVYNASGQKVATLLDGVLGEGHQLCRFNGLDSRGRALSGGVYLLKLQAGGEERTQRVLLLK
ncbi:MAG: M1 family aminopeptidase [Candidatus Krumholzibacteria bacterium]|jgi:aminopeptidase N|nr:M1 family aminopeptidase [Candidatus Krumholzibacteria bacterium]MDP6668982.1 M1 family aminopeptidase [Candidatus Krumholzibacteria bacterium]MDP7021366.1 M1 family aminopeptidase [Candidatus Krumholzibacteria bacterium]